jgi:uncharacterized glyoxalase superfamily protein PhnB
MELVNKKNSHFETGTCTCCPCSEDYDEAIAFYTEKLHFRLMEDTKLSETKRWVRVQPPGGGCELLLARAANEHQVSRLGDQTGGRVFLFLHTDDFTRDYDNLQKHGIKIIREPSVEEYGDSCCIC